MPQLAPELLRTDPTWKPHAARRNWSKVRQSDEVSKALASQSWTTVVKALRENDARISEAKLELERAKEDLAALDATLEAANVNRKLKSGGMTSGLSSWILSDKLGSSRKKPSSDLRLDSSRLDSSLLRTGPSVKDRSGKF